MRLGFSLQLTTVRYLGTFLVDPLDVPPLVTGHLARQLGIGVPISPVPASAPGQLGSPHPACAHHQCGIQRLGTRHIAGRPLQGGQLHLTRANHRGLPAVATPERPTHQRISPAQA